MHGGNLVLAGPVYWLFLGLTALIIGLAIFVLVDLVRAKHRAFQGSAGVRLLWAVPQIVFLVFALLAFTPGIVNSTIGSAVAALLVPVLAIQIAYLLRVVFPSPTRLAAHSSAICAPDDDVVLRGADGPPIRSDDPL